jgi:hypothetical protein
MRRSRTDRGPSGLATLALAGLLALVSVGGLGHTDDGCVVEVHCQTCVFALHAVDGAVAPVVLLPSVVVALVVASVPAEQPSAGAPQAVVSRGPPTA